MGGRSLRTVLAVVAAIVALTAGMAWGTAGQPLIMGRSNSAGTSNTGLSTASTGMGLGVAQSGGAGPALQGTDSSKSSSSTGVFGFASASTSNVTYGVRGNSASTAGRGVFGNASASSGTTYGVYGTAASHAGFGVYSNGRLGIASGKALVCTGCVTAGDLGTNAAWGTSGNPATASSFLGTTNSQPFIVKVNRRRALRIEPTADTPNLIGGSFGNSATARVVGATIAGGGGTRDACGANAVTDDFGTVGGGCRNHAGDNAGRTNDAAFAAVGGGFANSGRGPYTTVGGGNTNSTSGVGATASGGELNTATGRDATVGGGRHTSATGFGSFAVGFKNHADGNYSFAAGQRATALQVGTFAFADSTDHPFLSGGIRDTFNVRAVNGVWLWTSVDKNGDIAHGCRFTGAGNLNCDGAINGGSSRTLKHQFRPVSDATILAKVARLPVSTWSYKGDPSSVRHIGPVSEDFSRAFHPGDSTKAIDVMDEAGVSFAAIKALYGRSVTQAAAISRLRSSVRTLHARATRQGRQIATLQREVKTLLKASKQ